MRINWNNKTIVRFANGQYAVRRGRLCYTYFDVTDKKWWALRHASRTLYHNEAVEWLNYKAPNKDWGTPVSIIPPPPGR